MKIEDLEARKESILKKLQQAGTKGLNKSKLKIKSSKDNLALKELEKERKIANLERVKNRYLYVLKEFDVPFEIACDKVEKKALSNNNTLFSRTIFVKECKKGAPGRVKKDIDRAIEWLVKEKKLLKLRYRNYFLFAHLSSIRSLLPKDKETFPKLDLNQVLKAYKEVKRRAGFSDIEIYKLQQELNVDINTLKDFLLEQSRKGRALLSSGDWSLSSEKTRSGAIYSVNSDKPYLLVCFKE